MISLAGGDVAHLGGNYGDRLSLSKNGGLFEHVADLGWDAPSQTTPQRRILLTPEALFVLEPVQGPLLAPPLRVRQFDPVTRQQVGMREGPGEEGLSGLSFFAQAIDTGSMKMARCGIDPVSGAPQRWEGVLPRLNRLRVWPTCSGVPLHAGDRWWYPFRLEGPVAYGGADAAAGFDGDCAAGCLLGGRAAIPGVRRGRSGAWIDGVWSLFKPGTPRLFTEYRSPLTATLAPLGAGLVALETPGGALAPLGAPAELAKPRLPRGHYTALAALPRGLFGVEERSGVRLVPVAF